MRVIAGTARSMPLKTVKGMDVRPTTDKTKETLFNVLQTDVPDSRFLDLFMQCWWSRTARLLTVFWKIFSLQS